MIDNELELEHPGDLRYLALLSCAHRTFLIAQLDLSEEEDADQAGDHNDQTKDKDVVNALGQRLLHRTNDLLIKRQGLRRMRQLRATLLERIEQLIRIAELAQHSRRQRTRDRRGQG